MKTCEYLLEGPHWGTSDEYPQYSYDMKAVTKEWSIAEKNIPSFMGIEPGPPG